jgi:hypothetical protein
MAIVIDATHAGHPLDEGISSLASCGAHHREKQRLGHVTSLAVLPRGGTLSKL